ncbi:MAG: branched-chain amino acid ABC transporter substrate-binding protein [Burkholderiales bacterium]
MTINGRLFIVGASAIALLGACGKTEDPKPAAKAAAAAPAAPESITIRIGHVGPLTGGIAHLGKDNENGARLAVEEANAAGIKIDGKLAKFELIAEDDQADPKVGTTVAQKLVDAKVAGIVGHLNSGVTIPASEIYNQAGIPMISGSATNPQVTERGYKVTFRVVGRDDQQGPAVAQYLSTEAKPKIVALIDDATAYGEGIANEVEKTLKASGISVLPREKGTDKTTDWKAVLTKVKGGNPDAVFFGGMDATGGPLLKQGRELGIKAVFSFGDGACTDKMKELAGDASEGLICSQAGLPPQAASQKFLDAYKKKFNVEPILYAPFTYDAANLLIEAMKQANSADPAKYLSALAGISHAGATGKIAFDAKGDRKDAEITIFTMKGGKIEPLAVLQGGKSTKFDDFIKMAAGAMATATGTAQGVTDAAKDVAKGAMQAVGDAAKDAAAKALDVMKK